MSKIPEGVPTELVPAAARRVLLDGLIALDAHLAALTVVGAQAVYLRTEDVKIAVSPFTSDGDLGVDPDKLADYPLLEKALGGAGFERIQASQPGLWRRETMIGGRDVPVELDLLVGDTFVDGGRRSVHLPPHDKMSVLRVPGLEPSVVDRDLMTITALEPGDPRSVAIHVAGPAALLVAKAHKLHDRLADSEKNPDRLTNKDAADVYRLFVGPPAVVVRDRFDVLLASPRVAAVTARGLGYLKEQFGGRDAPGVRLAADALLGAVPESRVRAVMPAYVAALPEQGSRLAAQSVKTAVTEPS